MRTVDELLTEMDSDSPKGVDWCVWPDAANVGRLIQFARQLQAEREELLKEVSKFRFVRSWYGGDADGALEAIIHRVTELVAKYGIYEPRHSMADGHDMRREK